MNWTKSSRCASSACVEVTSLRSDNVVFKDGKDPSGDVLTFTREEWTAFRDGVKAGDFDHI